MGYIPSSPDEVKSIIEAVNLKTLERFTYLKTDQGICRYPIAIVQNGIKSLEAAIDEFLWDAEDPDQEIGFMDPEPTQAGDGKYSGGMLMFRERERRSGEGSYGQLAWLQARATAEINPGRTYEGEKERRSPERVEVEFKYWQHRLGHGYNEGTKAQKKVKRPAARPENIIKLPAAEKIDVSHRRPSVDILKYARTMTIGEEWERFFRVMYKKSCYKQLFEMGGYAGKCRRKMRCYTQGNKELERTTGLSKNTVSRYLMAMKKNKIILRHKRGYKKQGCSIWELPFDLDHVFAWKRSPIKNRIRNFSGTA